MYNIDGGIEVLTVVIVWIDDGIDELSIELDALVIVVVITSVSNEDVAVSIEVANGCDVDDNSAATDEVWSLSEVNKVVNIDVSDEMKSLYTAVVDIVDNVLVCSIEEYV